MSACQIIKLMFEKTSVSKCWESVSQAPSSQVFADSQNISIGVHQLQ